MSDLERPAQPAPLADAAPGDDALDVRPSLRATGFLSAADIQRALAAASAKPVLRSDEPAQGC